MIFVVVLPFKTPVGQTAEPPAGVPSVVPSDVTAPESMLNIVRLAGSIVVLLAAV